MGETIVELAGTPAGSTLALALVLLSALSHALFGAINKGGADPWLNRAAINICYGLIAAPFALFVLPWPTANLWPWIGATYLIHIFYEAFQSSAFNRGAFTVVYPIARGTGPLAAAVLAGFVFGETLEAGQWGGVLLLSSAIFALAYFNMRAAKMDLGDVGQLKGAIIMALLTGIMVAVYTTVDAYGIRQAENPFTFLAWFFMTGGVGFPLVAVWRWRRKPVSVDLADLGMRGVAGALIAFLSFGSILLATRLDQVSEAAALRETSIIFATAIGVLIFHEKISAARLAAIACIALGAILVEFG